MTNIFRIRLGYYKKASGKNYEDREIDFYLLFPNGKACLKGKRWHLLTRFSFRHNPSKQNIVEVFIIFDYFK